MIEERAHRLERRFAESDSEWRRIGDAAELEAFLGECLGTPLPEPLPPVHLDDRELGFTLADGIILETGSIVLSGRHPAARRVAFLAEVHYALVAEEACHETLAGYLALGDTSMTWRERVGHQLTLITGPSRTADIEKTLVLGAHGPRRLIIGSAPALLLRSRFGDDFVLEEQG